MTTRSEQFHERFEEIQHAIASFEQLYPDLSEAIRTLGLTIDEYEMILSDALISETGASGSTVALTVE